MAILVLTIVNLKNPTLLKLRCNILAMIKPSNLDIILKKRQRIGPSLTHVTDYHWKCKQLGMHCI